MKPWWAGTEQVGALGFNRSLAACDASDDIGNGWKWYELISTTVLYC